MATVLPPVEGAQAAVPQPAESSQVARAELKLSLTRLRQVQVQSARTQFNVDLTVLRETHVRNQEQRQDSQIKDKNRALRREAKQERIRLKHRNATKIQALVRSFFVRRQVLPIVLEAKRKEELEKSRVALTDTMLGLHQNIHDLAFLQEDRRSAATRIQAWWRGVLAKRLVAIIRLRHHLVKVGLRMAKAATILGAYSRGRQARMGCFRLRLEREERLMQAKRQHHDRMIMSIIKVQSHVRRRFAMKNIQDRKVELSKELEGEGLSDHHEPRSPKIHKSPERGDRRRRHRHATVQSENGKPGQGSGHGKHRGAVTAEGIVGFEAGGMVLAEEVQQQRQSYQAAHRHKLQRGDGRQRKT